MLGDRKTVVLRGGAPWGFRLSGGGPTPIYIAKVFANSLFCLPPEQFESIFTETTNRFALGSKS